MRELTVYLYGGIRRHGGPGVLALDDGERYYLAGATDSVLLDFGSGGASEAALLAVVEDRLSRAAACPQSAAALRYVKAARAHLKGGKR